MADDMNSLKFRDRIHQRRRQGQPLTDDEIMFITNESAELAGAGSNVSPDHIRWATKANKVLDKPVNEINKDDARDVTSKETRAFEKLPATGSVASHVQSVADKNDEK